MTITLNGTTGITLPNGSASAPAATGSDTDTGIVYGTNTVSLATGGTTAVTVDSSQNVGINVSSPSQKLEVGGLVRVKSANGDSNGLNLSCDANGITYVNAGYATVGAIYFQCAGSDIARVLPSGNFQFNSGYGSVATAYGCRAWVNFNSTGTPAIRASGNVSSITDNGTGLFTANFTNAMPDGNYTSNITTRYTGSGDTLMACIQGTSYSTTSISARIMNSSFNLADSTEVSIAIFR